MIEMSVGQQQSPPVRDRSLVGLVTDLVRDAAKLGAQEVSLLRAEMGERANNMVGGLIMLGAAAVFAVITLSLIVEAAVSWLTLVLGSELAATAICAVVAGIIAFVLFMVGRGRLDPKNLSPKRTAQSLSEDVNLFARRVKS